MRSPIKSKKFTKRPGTIQKVVTYYFTLTGKDSAKMMTAFVNAMETTAKYTLTGDFDSCVQLALQREKKR